MLPVILCFSKDHYMNGVSDINLIFFDTFPIRLDAGSVSDAGDFLYLLK